MATAQKDYNQEFEHAADAIWNSEFLLIVAGPSFDEGKSFSASEYCDPATVSKPNKFMGYWGALLNEYSEKNPHEGFNILTRWRDRFFCQDDVRKRQGKKRPEDESELDRIPKCYIYTRSVSNMFQKSGFPAEEMYEMCGNIMYWQCSRIPPCCPKVSLIDRNFRFVIDETNAEAPPIKYVADRRATKAKEKFTVMEEDEDEYDYLEGQSALNPVQTKGLLKDERLKKMKGRIEKAQAIRIRPSVQIGAHRFQDCFSGFVTTSKEFVTGHTFPDAPEDPDALRLPELKLDDKEKTVSTVPAHQQKPEVKVLPPNRHSHLLAHVNALDRGMHEEKAGKMYVCDPEQWQKERDFYYQSVAKIFHADSYNVAMERAKTIRYNISVFFVLDDEAAQAEIKTYGKSNSVEPRPFVMKPKYREKLLAVYPPGQPLVSIEVPVPVQKKEVTAPSPAKESEAVALVRAAEMMGSLNPSVMSPPPPTEAPLSPVTSENPANNGAPSPPKMKTVMVSPEEAVIHEFKEKELKHWEQGNWGWYYFSHVCSRSTKQEPIQNKYHDTVRLMFPVDEDGEPSVVIPLNAKVSVVCETVVYTDPEAQQVQATKSSKGEAAVQPNPFNYTSNTWQMHGTLKNPVLETQSVAHEKKEKGTAKSSSSVMDEHDPSIKKNIEYVLETRKRHVFKIGSTTNRPSHVNYFEFELPCDETDPVASSEVVSRLTRTQDKEGVSSEAFASFMETLRREDEKKDSNKDPVPTPNHQLCAYCHDVARPFVLMTKPGMKDDGFCAGYLASRTKIFKAWEKQMMEAMKQDNNKALTILELGGEKKLEPCRAYAEKTFKQLKSGKVTFVRLSPNNLEVKKQGQQEQPNSISIVSPIVNGLLTLERLVNEKMRKVQRA